MMISDSIMDMAHSMRSSLVDSVREVHALPNLLTARESGEEAMPRGHDSEAEEHEESYGGGEIWAGLLQSHYNMVGLQVRLYVLE